MKVYICNAFSPSMLDREVQGGNQVAVARNGFVRTESGYLPDRRHHGRPGLPVSDQGAGVMNAAPDFNRDHAMNIMVRYIADMAPETSTEVAEAYASGQGHDEWLDDETHPVWDAAVDAFEEAYADAVAEYEQSEYAS